jgi:hypothetical protein
MVNFAKAEVSISGIMTPAVLCLVLEKAQWQNEMDASSAQSFTRRGYGVWGHITHDCTKAVS